MLSKLIGKRWGPSRTGRHLHLLIDNIGGGNASFGYLNGTAQQWASVFELNVISAVRATRRALPSPIAP